MVTKLITSVFAVLPLLFVNCTQNVKSTTRQTTEKYRNIEFEMDVVKEPLIPNYTVSIKDFGAVNGGQVLNTKAFADAIDAVTKKGGGKVVIPQEFGLTGPIILKSNWNYMRNRCFNYFFNQQRFISGY